jgi:CRISPR-associated protein Cas1
MPQGGVCAPGSHVALSDPGAEHGLEVDTMAPDDPADPLVRVMALHSLTYCERLYYLEEVEEIRIANDLVYAGRALHQEIGGVDPSGTELRELQLSSERIGLHGKVDAVRTRDGHLVPYEHKRGRAHRGPDNQPEAWPTDAVQVAAYALLLEDDRDRPVPEGRVRYHADNVTVRVPIDAALRAEVGQLVLRARGLRRSTERPPVTPDERKCARCSLAPVCLPEEERLVARPHPDAPARLFPAIPDRQVLHVITPGARVAKSGERLVVKERDTESKIASLPVREVAAVVLHGFAQISTQALHLCAEHDVGIHWLTGGGRHIGALAPGPGPVQRRVRQYQALADPGTALTLARHLTLARMESQLRYLLRATRDHPTTRQAVQPAIDAIRVELAKVPRAESTASLRGHEGTAARGYFQALPDLLLADLDPALKPSGRSRRPPRDPFNAALSFGYALLYLTVLNAVIAVGLEPAFGFFHTPRSSAHPLVLDLMELFRVTLWDMPLIGSINRRQWDLSRDFAIARDHVWLSDSGRRKAIDLFERRLLERWRHPVLDYSLSYARAVELEVRLLEKEWSGSPGLFAQARLR